MLMRMLSSVAAAAPGLSWEALILYADPGEEAWELPKQIPQVRIYDQKEHFPSGRPSWPAMMQFLLERTQAPWFMYASDDIVFAPNSIFLALAAVERWSGLAGGVAMAYRNVHATDPNWTQFGIDLTLGDQILVNYGFLNTALAKAVGGFCDAYQFYCADGDLCLRILQTGHRIIPCLEAQVLHDNIFDHVKASSQAVAERDIATYRQRWTSTYYDISTVQRLLPHAPVADILLPPGQPALPQRQIGNIPLLAPGGDSLFALYQTGLYRPGQPLRLHLGCGEKYLEGFINIDYPPDQHSVMTPRTDAFADITQLHFPDNCLDEIRLHHVFEHFTRVEALGLLIRWHRWLRVGGTLHLETPDLSGSAHTILQDVPFKQKCAAVRHLVGDQTERWGFHRDLWFPDRFAATLSHLGFGNLKIHTSTWDHPPYLANVTAIGVKTADLPSSKLLQAADELLWLSTVAPAELPSYEIWKRQLRDFLAYRPVHPSPTPCIHEVLPPPPDSPPLEEIHDFNQRQRDRWVATKAAATPAGAAILDVGAGTCPYRPLFAHCRYMAHDFKAYMGVKLGGGTAYGEIDLVSDITAIPAPEASFDVVLCTEVLEHVPEPVAALREMVRLLRPGGRLLITAPLGSGLHQEPYHYYGGFTRHFYERFLPALGIHIVELRPNGGFFLHLAQECARVAWIFEEHRDFHGERAEAIHKLFAEHLPRYLQAMDARYPYEAFTVGYFVEGVKMEQPPQSTLEGGYGQKNKQGTSRTSTPDNEKTS